ncbi:pyridoxamine 5'-phosphate oxidase family protein [Macrococcoides canis]|uniref:General stress protein 26 n=1 Tax=Macrococcoides canis TaxID=1855823 RepID=A0A1W7A8Y7_9STAP|nr:pyridoxamine 5'-phosphate oxidase family protein [Macrococcus canis]ARQ05856.1 General stress protein 26 [Macrococcus canis]UJS27955.1 pyridoxamine 5'-phosphate oxidase family protein [Macrococcus canis]UTH00226.1 pyridoxamine 5'-phosphate oxidase family protein [Macrococcus canis]UTH11700.1 pyridoxamine 5'-phosphate oxidase family protein [Macrococcus canis]WBF52767.1 pyridoxamine 5'-phosphate oxidase family protein [Macrococcus canis]
MNQKENYNKLFELIEKNDIAMMTTIQDNKLVSRPMSYQEVDASGNIWFMSTRTEKTEEIENDNRVNLAFTKKGFVSIAGNASIVNDNEKIKEYWNKGIEAFLSTKPEDPNVVLIKVVPESAEYWATDDKVKTVVEGIKSLVSNDKGSSEDSSINESLDLK